MSSPTILAIHSSYTQFAPRKPKIVSIGKTSVLLYPKVNASMSDLEKAMAFQQNKTALTSADLNQKERILTLADCLDLMLTAESSLADWERKLRHNWANFVNLSILSWHSANSSIINTTATIADASILLPVQNGPANACRTSGMKFVRVQLTLDYANLKRTDPAPNTMLRENITSNFLKIPLTLLTWLAMPIDSPLSLVPPIYARYPVTKSSVTYLGQPTRTLLTTSSRQSSISPPSGLISR